MDLIEAEHGIRAGWSELVLKTKDVDARVKALKALDVHRAPRTERLQVVRVA